MQLIRWREGGPVFPIGRRDPTRTRTPGALLAPGRRRVCLGSGRTRGSDCARTGGPRSRGVSVGHGSWIGRRSLSPGPTMSDTRLHRGDRARSGTFVARLVDRTQRHAFRRTADQDFSWSGRRDSNPRPSPWQGHETGPPRRLPSVEHAPLLRLVRPLRRVGSSPALDV